MSDKSGNLYLFNVDEYHKAIGKEVNNTYKRAPAEWENNINNEANIIRRKLKIDDRVQKLNKQENFLKVKDHKDNFPNNPQFTD